MIVLNLSSSDYSNMSHENANALRSVGVYCLDVCLNAHPFGYATQSKPVTRVWMVDHYMTFDVIQIFHTDEQLYEIVKKHPRVIIYHTGTRYRENKEHFDHVFKGRRIATDQCEFLLHDSSFRYIAPHTSLKPKEKDSTGKLIIGHYPSNPDVKGTADIERMLSPFVNDFDIRIDSAKVSHEKNMKRVAECHIYIELFKPTLNGKPYGCFGVSAFEATALGCVTITNNINRAAYEDVYGHSHFAIANDEKTFTNMILSLSDREQYEFVHETLQKGFHQKHSITETGLRIKQICE